MGDKIIIIRNGNREDDRPRTLDGEMQHYSNFINKRLGVNLAGRRGNRD
jgi:hypothetical protein